MKGHPLPENKYDAVKKLSAHGMMPKEINEITGVGVSTINKIKISANYAEYREATSAGKYSLKKKEEPKPQTVTVVAERFLMEEVKKQTELLTTISAKLAFIVDELTK